VSVSSPAERGAGARVGVSAVGASASRPTFFRIGAVCACAGGTLALVGNLLHGPADVTEEGLRELAGNGHFGIYRGDHFVLALALILALGGLAAIAESIEGERGFGWARHGSTLAVMGAAVIMVALGLDGFAMVAMARAWASAGPGEQGALFAAARGVWSAFLGMFALGVFSYFGCMPLFYGAALRRCTNYPRWLGYVAHAGGLVGMALGAILAFVTITFSTFAILFGITTTLFSFWVVVAGATLWRDTDPAA
jgi:hypothetical protein